MKQVAFIILVLQVSIVSAQDSLVFKDNRIIQVIIESVDKPHEVIAYQYNGNTAIDTFYLIV